MVDAPSPTADDSRDTRDRAIAIVSQLYADGVMSEDELERRIERVEQAETRDELDEIIRDLRPICPRSDQGLTRAIHLARTEDVALNRRMVAVFGTAQQVSTWLPARVNRVFTVCGNAHLDFRQAQLGAGTTEVRLRCVMGEITIIVPPGMSVDVECNLVLANVGRDEPDSATAHAPGMPGIRITGLVVLGKLKIEARQHGETAREAKHRRRSDAEVEHPPQAPRA